MDKNIALLTGLYITNVIDMNIGKSNDFTVKINIPSTLSIKISELEKILSDRYLAKVSITKSDYDFYSLTYYKEK